MKIVVIRHAKTVYNENGIINGQQDDNLSPEGLLELPGLVEKLNGYNFTALYSSPLQRAVETAKPIAKNKNLDLIIDPRLIEVNFGSFTSKNWDSMKSVFGMKSTALLDSYNYDLRPYGGESSEEVRKRIEDFLNYLKEQGGQPVAVSHAGIIRWFYYLCIGQKISSPPNASVHLLDF
jgi:broad specificity phosphatase PhoE